MTPFTYPEVGATRDGPFPDGYRHLTHRSRLPAGALPAAAEAVMTWRMHRGTGTRIEASAPRAAIGVAVTSRLGLGPVRVSAPCQVVWTVGEPDRVGFGYGTLPGHPAQGEESFVVSRAGDGTVWFTVSSFSRPARWYVRAAGPVVPLLQRAYARRCARVLRRLSTASQEDE
ncbi:MAG: DUF1990 family protein [Micromonosporaceae bacterium]|nr:DUF1990 family protein [Micromonosporaceae bacterium]